MRRSIKSLILNNLGRVLLAASIAGAAAAPRAHAQDLVWAKLFPNWNNYGVSADGLGGVYITGEAPTFPYPAGFLARLESGSIQWSQERNPYGFSAGWDVCADG
jgi:hypothetical protein